MIWIQYNSEKKTKQKQKMKAIAKKKKKEKKKKNEQSSSYDLYESWIYLQIIQNWRVSFHHRIKNIIIA